MIATTPATLLLLQFPAEVLINVFSFLDFPSLCNAILVSKHFDALAEPFLYHSIVLTNGRQASALTASLQALPRRTTWVRSLLVSTKFGDDHGLNTLPPLIAQMRNLQNLCLETPDCNAKFPEERVSWVNLQDRYERIFEAASAVVPNSDERVLPHLRSCTLHFVDAQREIYSMTRYPMLFLHPNLRSLTLSCASTDFPNRLLVPFQGDQNLVKATRLEHLHLEECDIFSPSLAILLSFPRALRSLKISEGIRYDGMFTRNSRLHGNVSPAAFVDALTESCIDSLEHLSLSLGHAKPSHQSFHHFTQHLNLSAFHAIKQLDLDVRTVNLIRLRACDHSTWRRFPPNLETLKVFGIPLGDRPPFHARRRVWFPFETCLASDKARHGVRLLSTLIYSYEYFREDAELPRLSISDDGEPVEELSQVLIAHRLMMEKCKDMQPVFRKANVRLEIEMVALPSGFIPPYLFTEDAPKTFILWESAPR